MAPDESRSRGACVFDFARETLGDGRIHKYALLRNAEPLGYGAALDLWRHDEAFRAFFIGLLIDSPFAAYRWETPPITTDTVGRPFEFVLLEAGWLDGPPDAAPFAEHFTSGTDDEGIVVFENLGGDALLVAPSPRGEAADCVHLASFMRGAPDEARHALWRVVGAAVRRRLGDRPVWLSTAGGGLAWLHVRLDARPKYYGFAPYTMFAPGG